MRLNDPLALLLAALSILLSGTAQAAAPTAESRLLEAMQLQKADDVAGARAQLEALLRQHPNFQLARWLRDEAPALNCVGDDALAESDARDWQEEACRRWAAHEMAAPPGWLPDSLIQLAPQTRQAIVVDLTLGRLYLFRVRKQHPTLSREHYVAMGRDGFGKRDEGDLRTPLGIYRIEKWLDGKRLPPLYGAGALTLNYPNRWDQLRQRSGAGIWLHGVPMDTYVRAPFSSEGCITMANEDLLALRRGVRSGETLVVISDRLDWLSPEDFAQMRNDIVARIEGWKTQRTAEDWSDYRRLYSREFDNTGQDVFSFMAHKREIVRDAPTASSSIHNLELLRFPDMDEGTLIRARFLLRERGNTLRVEQFWRQEGSDWKILREDIQRP